MANNYAVVRLDLMTGTADGSKLVSSRYYDGSNAPADIQNGMVVHITDTLLDREVFKTTAPSASDTIETVGLVASVELDKDATTITGLSDFINKADGEPQRVYRFESGCIFSVTAPAISGTPAKGGYVKLGTTPQWVYTTTASDGVGTIIDKETIKGVDWFVIKIK
jgi:hypothetical protein